MINGIDSVLIFVKNLKTQIEFYENVLGLVRTFGNDSMVQYKFNSLTSLVLHKVRDPANFKQDGNIHFNFHVKNLEVYFEGLTMKGVKVLKSPKNGGFGYLVATIVDPENNEIDLLEPL